VPASAAVALEPVALEPVALEGLGSIAWIFIVDDFR